MRTFALVCALAVVGGLWLSGCSTAPKSQVARENLEAEARTALQTATNTDPTLQTVLDNAAGYAVFPNVGKGALIAGGAFGRGILYENGRPVGYASLTQASIGLSAGGAEYTEIVALETPEAVNNFKNGELAFTAGAKAVALRTGVAATAAYSNNILVFTMGQGGLLVDASVAGQKFSYQPLGAVPPTAPATGTARAPAGAPGTAPMAPGAAGTAGTSGTGGATARPTSATTVTPR